MKGSVFHNASGAFLVYGKQSNSAVQREITAGHVFIADIDGGGPGWLKHENGMVVPDMPRRQADIDRKAAQAQERQDLQDVKADVLPLIASLNAATLTPVEQDLFDLSKQIIKAIRILAR